MKIFDKADVETKNFRIFASLTDSVSLFSERIRPVHIGDEFDDFVLNLVSECIFVLFRKFFDDPKSLYQEIVGGSVHREIIVLGHGFLVSLVYKKTAVHF